jgi:peroxiredoxin
MAEQSNQGLQQAEQLLREGKKQEARAVLVGYVRSNPSSTRGWWMLSFALTDPKQQIECVERVLWLDPNYAPARARLEKLNGSVQSSVSPFVETTSPQPVIVSSQPAKGASSPASQKPAPRPGKKANNLVLQYAVLAVMGCMAMGVVGFGVVMIVRGYSNVPMQAAPLAQPVVITPTLPPTWTPPATATLIATQTPFPTNTPLVMPTSFVLPTATVPKSQIAPIKGSYAPDFKLINVDGDKQVKLSNYGGRGVIIFFWATWCQYCKAEMPAMQMIYQAYENQGLVVLAVDVGESASQARRYRKSQSLTFPVLNDADQVVSSKYRVAAFPTHFFVDPSGVISSVNVGTLDYWGLNAKVKAMLNLTQ